MECKVWPPRMNGPVAYIALYGAMYAAFGVASPFWPKFYASKALTPQQIGIVLAVGMSMRLVAGPLIGLLADFISALRLALSVLSSGAVARPPPRFCAIRGRHRPSGGPAQHHHPERCYGNIPVSFYLIRACAAPLSLIPSKDRRTILQ